MPDHAPDTPTAPVPEPVYTGYIISLIVGVIGAFGVDASNEWVGKVASAAAALIVAGVSAYITRNRVTPEVTAQARIEAAKDEVLASVEAAPVATPRATVVQVSDTPPTVYQAAHTDREWIVPRHPVDPAPPAADTHVDRDEPTTPPAPPSDPNRCPTCAAPILYATTLNQRNGRWTVLPLERADAPDVEADFELTGDTHQAVDMFGQPVGVFPVALHVNSSTGNNWRTHPPSHFLGHEH